MINDDEIRNTAKIDIERYLGECACATTDDAAHALGFLLAYTSQALIATRGLENGLKELIDILHFSANAKPPQVDIRLISPEGHA